MNQKDQTRKLPGFYIALCCCVIAIGAAGFIAQHMESKTTNAVTPVEEDVIKTQEAILPLITELPGSETASSYNTIVVEEPTEEPAEQENSGTEAAASAETAVEEYAVDNPDVAAASVTVNAEDSGMFASPVPASTILEGYSGDTLKYNTVYEDWRTHNGIDIEASVGCSVSAAADGTVCEVTEGSYGKQVTIQHNNGYSTVYAQLGDINVALGDEVSSGSVIGTVGESRGENINAPHLHYEIRRDGNPLNPEEL
ncbi:MAG: peptidoglycan DD-metalloendopeptidase family protein [Candidatus Ornithomonoglobus sp.]